MEISVELGDITKVVTDCIINPANPTLMWGGGVDWAIHTAAGPELREECKTLRKERFPDGMSTGDVVATRAYNLPCKHVVHTVGPVYGCTDDSAGELRRAILNSLDLAEKLGARSVTLPAISTGSYGYPVKEAAAITVQAVRDSGSRLLVKFVLFDMGTFQEFSSLIR
jgi:O-acetyl-ADP-ribose deacetylase